MKIFNLPDLGEGLVEAEIVRWLVKEGDMLKADQPMVEMETAKAVVEVPSPHFGKVLKFYGQAGDIIATGAPLLEFETAAVSDTQKSNTARAAGSIHESNQIIQGHAAGLDIQKSNASTVRVMPAVRQLAKQFSIDLEKVVGSGVGGAITAEDVKNAVNEKHLRDGLLSSLAKTELTPGFEPLRGIRRTMAMAMEKSHAEVVPVTLFDDADIHAWQVGESITVRMIHAIAAACAAEPALNAFYNGEHRARQLQTQIHLGLAMDAPDGLFVPVLKNVGKMTPAQIREKINEYKKSVSDRSIAPADLQGATIILSNFGSLQAGKYATPIVVPPTVAIIGMGRLYESAVPVNGCVEIHRMIPLSLSVDHRAITGGETTRFLKVLLDHLKQGCL